MTRTQKNILKAPLVLFITLPIGILLTTIWTLGDWCRDAIYYLEGKLPKFE